jgi:DNA-binding NarL/FixJ family response regulator
VKPSLYLDAQSRQSAKPKPMKEYFERHKQAWTSEEVQKLHAFAKKGMTLKAIAKALTRSEESIRTRSKLDKLKIAKKR